MYLISFIGSDLHIGETVIVIWWLKTNMIHKLLLGKWQINGGCIIVPDADHRLDSLHGTSKRKKGKQIFLHLPAHSFTPAGLQMPETSLAVRLLILVRESSWSSPNFPIFEMLLHYQPNELDLAKELWK